LPIGLASAWSTKRGLDAANQALEGRARDQALVAGEAIQNLLTRNRLSIRVAANAALVDRPRDPCMRVQQILALTPDLGREFSLSTDNGELICEVGKVGPLPPPARLAPGDVKSWISANRDAILLRAGVMGGTATVRVPASSISSMISEQNLAIHGVVLSAEGVDLPVYGRPGGRGHYVVTVPMEAHTLPNGKRRRSRDCAAPVLEIASYGFVAALRGPLRPPGRCLRLETGRAARPSRPGAGPVPSTSSRRPWSIQAAAPPRPSSTNRPSLVLLN
jgi:hypothetical protein